LLIPNGENVKVAQSQLRHTTPKITLEFYAHAVSADQQEAHKKVVQMVLPSEFLEKLKGAGRYRVETRVSLALGVRGVSEISPAEIS
jgi:hypothetical protein